MEKVYKIGDLFTDERFTFEVIGFDSRGLRIAKRLGETSKLAIETKPAEIEEPTDLSKPIIESEVTIKQMQKMLLEAGKEKESKLRKKADLIKACKEL